MSWEASGSSSRAGPFTLTRPWVALSGLGWPWVGLGGLWWPWVFILTCIMLSLRAVWNFPCDFWPQFPTDRPYALLGHYGHALIELWLLSDCRKEAKTARAAFEGELGVQAPVGFWDPAGQVRRKQSGLHNCSGRIQSQSPRSTPTLPKNRSWPFDLLFKTSVHPQTCIALLRGGTE